MDELVAKELGRLMLAMIKQGAMIEALKAEIAKRDAEIERLKAAGQLELPVLGRNGGNGHANPSH